MFQATLPILAVLAANIALSEWLARRTPLRHLGSALLVIVVTAITANAGLIPTYAPGRTPLYEAIFSQIAPLAIFLLLLRVRLAGILRAGVPMLVLFVLGSLGTLLGVLAGMFVLGGERTFGELHFALGGMFVGTYTGGSINFNAVALEYGVAQNGALYAGAAVVDSAMTTIWMAATVLIPRILPSRQSPSAQSEVADAVAESREHADDTETTHPVDLSILLALGAASLWIAERVAERTDLPWSLVLTTIALVLAQLPPIQRLRGARLCGMLAVMMFLAVIGALCDLSALMGLGRLGVHLLLFAATVVGVHGFVIFAGSWVLRLDPAVAAVASQANIGGGTTALALARGLGRADLVLPGILVGSLGTALGTYLGLLAAYVLR